MKNGFYFMLTCVVLLCGSCLKDDTNEDYRQLVKPVLLNEEKLPELFVENHVYSVKYGEELVITPEVSYPDLSDLEYEWRING